MKQLIQHKLKPVSLHFVLLLSILFTAVGPASLAVTPVQAAGAAWYDGPIQYSSVENCASIIQGSPYYEKGAGTYVGFLADPENSSPAPNDVYYLHVVIAGLGNSCSGQRAYIDLGLPASTSLAIDATNQVYCFYNNVALTPASDCPQTLPGSSYNSGMYEIPSPDSAHAYTWPIPQGKFLEIQIPVRSSTQLTDSKFQAKVWMLDGNSSPWLTPQQGVFVFSNQTTILYPNPSTTLITSTNAHSEALLYTHGISGTGYFDLGTDTTYALAHEPVTIPAGGNGWKAWIDWAPPALLPDTTYHWRFTFTSSNGQTIGDDQTFRTLPDGVMTVGSGMTGSCTEAGLTSALATAKEIKFTCGPLPTTIQLTGVKSISSEVTIDGGNLVTLSANGTSNHFDVQAGGHLTLKQIKLADGKNTGACGGSIHVYANGKLTVNETSFYSNTTTMKGGAICVDANGQADLDAAQFTNNQSNGGGGVFNWGQLSVNHSYFSQNKSTMHGGAIQNYGSGVITDTTLISNTAATNGGGIDAGGTLVIDRSTFTSNTAGVRGGGINDYGGKLTVSNSAFLVNHSLGYGGGIANDLGTVDILSSEFSGNTAKSVGGGIRSNGATSITNSTLSGNHADGSGGGIENSENTQTLALNSATLASNTAGTTGGNIYMGAVSADHATLKNTLITAGSPNNCDQPVTTQGYNLENANSCGLTGPSDHNSLDPKLGPLQNNGGPTRTYALLPGSPAIDGGYLSGCPAVDQRGYTRPQDGNGDGSATCDIGAFEASSLLIKIFLPAVIK